MARNLIVCCDGTWNDPRNKDDGVLAPTNVFKLFSALDLDHPDTVQLSRYQAGVGTEGWIDKLSGGLLGIGLNEDIRDCYDWIAKKYHPGDHIYLFGFSRGAFTARSLAGMICKCGILDVNASRDIEQDVKRIFRRGYRNGERLGSEVKIRPNSRKVKFVGVWDTVGALGIPNDKAIANLFDDPGKHQFHDTQLSSKVAIARHAVAIDEKRGSFTPTLWDEQTGHRNLVQKWFAGVHSDVGGGYKETGLSDCALQWMMDEAARRPAGLLFKANSLKQIKPNPQDELHDSHAGLMKVLVTAPRSLPQWSSEAVHPSAKQRQDDPPLQQGPYRRLRELTPSAEVDIYAKHDWNWTGIYLEAGRTYTFSAHGQWHDASISCGPDGTNDGDFHIGELAHTAMSLWGAVEQGFQAVTGNEDANFFGTRRVEHAEWFELMGAVADGGNPREDGTHEPPTTFVIGSGCTFKPETSGYLYCYANDAWGFYGNNRGFVTLNVTVGT